MGSDQRVPENERRAADPGWELLPDSVVGKIDAMMRHPSVVARQRKRLGSECRRVSRPRAS